MLRIQITHHRMWTTYWHFDIIWFSAQFPHTNERHTRDIWILSKQCPPHNPNITSRAHSMELLTCVFVVLCSRAVKRSTLHCRKFYKIMVNRTLDIKGRFLYNTAITMYVLEWRFKRLPTILTLQGGKIRVLRTL